ncbi:MAG: M61 family metallopeptidase [Pyrinomonadaceae bacterium]|nr:M61 family metallopeptidase [Pyrinomonadaceae bacterium]
MRRTLKIAMRDACCASLLILTFCAVALSQTQASAAPYKIEYHLAMQYPNTHLFKVNVFVEVPAATEHVDFQMPRWSPGRYAVFDFAKNVQEVGARAERLPLSRGLRAEDERTPLRLDDQTWRVETSGGNRIVRFAYHVFANDLSGTFSQLNSTHANFNGASVFMYVVDHKQDPVELIITPPNGWRVANGYMDKARVVTTQGAGGFVLQNFANYDLMIDTPTEVAPEFTTDEFRVDGKLYRVVVHSFGAEAGKRPALVRDIEKIVRAETAMWGAPEFDSYTFLIHFAADDRSGDGMEHLTSTNIIETGALADEGMYEDTLDTVAHEFFHVWNVKRLRPVGLGPWDFTRPANTRGLWIAEGFTNYYGHLMQRRAGLWTDAQLLATLSRYIGTVESAPGSRLRSAEELSVIAPLVDGAQHAQRTNLANTSIPGYYYSKGEVLALTLDLLIRNRTNGKRSLDDVMRAMYEEFYLRSPKETYYLRGRGYTNEDFARKTSEVTEVDFSDFFRRHVRGVEPPPYDEALSSVGLKLARTPAAESFTAGIALDPEARDARIINVRNDSPAERAGLNQGDVIISIANLRVTPQTWRSVLNRFKQNQTVPIVVKRDRRTVRAALTLGAPERFDYRIEEAANITPQQRALRTQWLSQNGGRN